MKDLVAEYSFKVPEDSNHADAGKKLAKQFDYTECETVEEAAKIAEEKGWSLLSFVNETLKGNARQSAYQNALAVYKPSTVTPEEIKERMVRDFIRLGLSESVAKAQVETILAANNG